MRIFAGLIVFAFTTAAVAQPAPGGQVDVNALVRRAIQHRLDASRGHHPMRYVIREVDEHGDKTKEVMETRDGDVDRVIAYGGKPLDAAGERAQMDRLDNFINHPELQMQRLRREEKNRATMDRLTRLVPDAFVFKMEGVEACATGECYKLNFAPNPKWSPPSMEARLFRGVAGEAWIDAKQERLERVEARIVGNVDFGFGILGRVSKGGTVSAEQRPIEGGEWVLTKLRVSVAGRLLMVKSFQRQFSDEISDAHPVPVMGYKEAIGILKQSAPAVDPGR